MSLNHANKIDTNKYELEISVGREAFKDAIEKAYRKNIGRMNVPGFRKGKAPRSIVEKYYGKGVFYEDAVNFLYPISYDEAVKEAGIEPVDRPSIEIVKIDDDGFVFKATVTVKPEVEIGEYKQLTAVKKVQKVTDEEVSRELARIQERNARIIAVEDRPAKKEDIVVTDFEGLIDGKPFEGGKAEKYSLTLGAGRFIPGFDDQIVGHSVNDEFEVSVTFPEDYHQKELAGKPAVFKVKLHEIKMRELPALDDEFAKDVSEFDTLEAFKEDIKKRLQEQKDNISAEEVENALIDKVIAGLKAEIPEVMYENSIDSFIGDFDYRLKSQGLNLQTYLQYTGMDMEGLRKTFREQAERQVKVRLALEKIVELEKIEVTDEELENEYKKISERYGIELDKIKNIVNPEDLKKDIAVNKAVDLIHSTAVITEEAA